MKICDFCSQQPPLPSEWLYDCKDFRDVQPQVSFIEEWHACGQCSQLIEEENLKGLIERAWLTYSETHPQSKRPESQVKNHLYQIYVKFWNHRKGARRPNVKN